MGVTKELISAAGESAIEERLCYFSYISRRRDLRGIDFICQLREDSILSQKYFYVEAKAKRHFKKIWSRGIEKRTIRLWLEQRFPVFVVVYDIKDGECYWTSIEDIRGILTRKLPNDKKTISIKVDKSRILEKGEGKNQEFIKKVEEDIDRINVVRGIPQFTGKGYVHTQPIVYLSAKAIERVRGTVRLGMEHLIYNNLFRNEVRGAERQCELLANFDPTGHYEVFVLLARIKRMLGKLDEAEKNYEIAINICKDDLNWNKWKGPEHPFIEDIIVSIEKEKESLRFGQ